MAIMRGFIGTWPYGSLIWYSRNFLTVARRRQERTMIMDASKLCELKKLTTDVRIGTVDKGDERNRRAPKEPLPGENGKKGKERAEG